MCGRYFSYSVLGMLFMGPVFLVSAQCPADKFGPNCQYDCHCGQGISYDNEHGCRGNCSQPWSGPTCQRGGVRLNGLAVYVGNSSTGRYQLCYQDNTTQGNNPGDIITQSCNSVVYGDTFKITLRSGTLTLCEVQVFECLHGLHGENCELKCGHCLNDATCSKTSGECPVLSNNPRCETGYSGTNCSQRCEPGTSGDSCANDCSATCVGSKCDIQSGICQDGQPPTQIEDDKILLPKSGFIAGVIVITVAFITLVAINVILVSLYRKVRQRTKDTLVELRQTNLGQRDADPASQEYQIPTHHVDGSSTHQEHTYEDLRGLH